VTAVAEGSRRVGDAAPYLSGKSCVFAAWKAVTLSPHSKVLRWGCFGVRRLDAAFVDAGVVERTSPGAATLQFRTFRRWGEEGARNSWWGQSGVGGCISAHE
jgi:hypothetical protein